MDIILNHPFTTNSQVDEGDVRRMKKALNRLGYYAPYEETGISGIPDDALKKFQSDNGLPQNGEARPNDETVTALAQISAAKQSGQYIWRTVGDESLRASHAALNGTLRDLSDNPDPAEDYNCRCWAEFLSNDRLHENAQNMKRIRAKITYLMHQLELIKARLDNAVKDVMRTKRKMEICQGRR